LKDSALSGDTLESLNGSLRLLAYHTMALQDFCLWSIKAHANLKQLRMLVLMRKGNQNNFAFIDWRSLHVSVLKQQ